MSNRDHGDPKSVLREWEGLSVSLLLFGGEPKK